MKLAVSLFLVVAVQLTAWSPSVHAQSPCRFVLGFATLRDLVGAQKVGSCLDDEHFNLENGNAEQRTTGGLLVWRKIDNFTAFTDGGTSWINGPNGLQSRPNNERFAWEKDPVQGLPSPTVSSSPPLVSQRPEVTPSASLPSTPTSPRQSAPSSPPQPDPALVSRCIAVAQELEDRARLAMYGGFTFAGFLEDCQHAVSLYGQVGLNCFETVWRPLAPRVRYMNPDGPPIRTTAERQIVRCATGV
jgi:hypothetical protein